MAQKGPGGQKVGGKQRAVLQPLGEHVVFLVGFFKRKLEGSGDGQGEEGERGAVRHWAAQIQLGHNQCQGSGVGVAGGLVY